MKTIYLKVLCVLMVAPLMTLDMFGQDTSQNAEKEVIIIERTVDENGNEIGRRITRKRGEEMSNEEWDDLLNQGLVPGDSRESADELFGQWFRRLNRYGEQGESKPTIGVSLIFEGDKAVISDVMAGSDAAEKDLRIDDHLVSINGLPISTLDDVRDALAGKRIGDFVNVVVIRDGVDIEKRIELRANRFGEMGFTFPNDLGQQGLFFDLDDNGDFKLFTDSLLRKLDLEGFMPQMRDFQWDNQYDRNRDPISSGQKGQLGVFIEDDARGIIITDVLPDSPADKAGLKKGDVISRVNDEVVTSYRELAMVMERKVKGDKLELLIERENEARKVEVELN